MLLQRSACKARAGRVTQAHQQAPAPPALQRSVARVAGGRRDCGQPRRGGVMPAGRRSPQLLQHMQPASSHTVTEAQPARSQGKQRTRGPPKGLLPAAGQQAARRHAPPRLERHRRPRHLRPGGAALRRVTHATGQQAATRRHGSGHGAIGARQFTPAGRGRQAVFGLLQRCFGRLPLGVASTAAAAGASSRQGRTRRGGRRGTRPRRGTPRAFRLRTGPCTLAGCPVACRRPSWRQQSKTD